ncbi:DUF2231 domain-containing protein [Brevibacillus fluminis]|uniref:DUF2231 domain-containing protein n=1 Tax=Brevibacillus fluminis TaxID=511487 RepID=UPI003F8A61C1
MLTEMPIHPFLVHFPIALFLIGTVFQLIALKKKQPFDTAATYLFLVGFLGGIASYLTGDGAEHFVERHFNGNLEDFVSPHETWALASLVVFGLILVLKLLPFLRKWSSVLVPVVLLLAIVGSGLIIETGHTGGKIVYNSQLGNASTAASDDHEDND